MRCTGFQNGNAAAVKHGAKAEIQLRPVREELDRGFSQAYPDLSPERRAILADRCARLLAARAFIDEKGVLADAELGEPWPILQRVEQWERMVDRTLAELEQRRRKSDEPGLEQLTAAGRRVREARESA